MGDDPRRDEGALRLGLIAGAGRLPAQAAQLLTRMGHSVEVFGFEGITDPDLVLPAHRSKLGQLERLADSLRKADRRRLLIVGKFSKTLLTDAREATSLLAPDAAALRLLAQSADWQDAGLMGALATWLDEQGFEVCEQDRALGPMIAQPGSITSRAPSEIERADAALGKRVAATLGRSGVGQSVAVYRGAVLALEAIEGTDAMIRRAGSLAGPGLTIVKGTRPGQDRRFDLPTIGPGTVAAMCEAGATALAVEAGSTLMVDESEMRIAAEAAGLALWAFEPEEQRS